MNDKTILIIAHRRQKEQWMFGCEKCILVVRAYLVCELYGHLDDGTGVCNFDRDTSLCTIYHNRPLICRVDDAYEAFFQDEMTTEQYYEMNYAACRKLRRQRRV